MDRLVEALAGQSECGTSDPATTLLMSSALESLSRASVDIPGPIAQDSLHAVIENFTCVIKRSIDNAASRDTKLEVTKNLCTASLNFLHVSRVL